MRPNIVRPGDHRYAELTTGMNQRYVANPDYVCLPRSTEEVVRAVAEALSSGRRISIRSGGHCFEDFVFHSETQVVLDLAAMNRVYFDVEHDAYAVESGARLLDAYEELFRCWGVTIPGGICYSVGAGGHVTGGGYGLLSRQHGLTVDHLYGVEVVVADADGHVRPVVATRDSTGPERDLWWAHTGGGGGNFGVVTRFLFRSPPEWGGTLVRPPEDVLVSVLALPWEKLDEPRFRRLLGNYSAWHEENRDADSPGGPLSSLLMLNHRSNGCVGLVAQIDADTPGATTVMNDYLRMLTGDVGGVSAAAPVGEFGALPGLERPRRLPWLRAARLLGTNTAILNDPTLRAEHKSAYVRASLPEEQLDIAYRQLTRSDVDNPNAMLVAFSYGGRIGSADPADTASAQRDSIFKLLYQSFWPDEADDAVNIGWVRDFYREMYAGTGGVPIADDRTDGCYVNYPDADLSDPELNTSGVPWHDLYYKANYPRLRRAKSAWDPRDVFRHAQSVRPVRRGRTT